MEIEYLKQLQKRYNTQLDLFAIRETYVDGTIKDRNNVATFQGVQAAKLAAYNAINGTNNESVVTANNFATVVPTYKKALSDLKLVRALEKRA